MNFGIILGQTFTDSGQASFDQLRERVQVAEELGFDLVCLGDRHLWPSGFHELLTTLAALAPVTSRIQLCSSGFILPIYNPILLAEQAAHVDVISGGRLIFGLVLGYREEELAISDVHLRQRRVRFLENLEVISRLWAGESVTFQGRFFRCRDVRIGPLPVRKPRPPIWIGGTADVVVRRSARLADGWLPSASLGRRELRAKIQVYRNALDEFGKQGSLVVARLGFVAKSRARARALVEKPLLAQYRRYSGWMKDTRREHATGTGGWTTSRTGSSWGRPRSASSRWPSIGRWASTPSSTTASTRGSLSGRCWSPWSSSRPGSCPPLQAADPPLPGTDYSQSSLRKGEAGSPSAL